MKLKRKRNSLPRPLPGFGVQGRFTQEGIQLLFEQIKLNPDKPNSYIAALFNSSADTVRCYRKRLEGPKDFEVTKEFTAASKSSSTEAQIGDQKISSLDTVRCDQSGLEGPKKVEVTNDYPSVDKSASELVPNNEHEAPMIQNIKRTNDDSTQNPLPEFYRRKRFTADDICSLREEIRKNPEKSNAHFATLFNTHRDNVRYHRSKVISMEAHAPVKSNEVKNTVSKIDDSHIPIKDVKSSSSIELSDIKALPCTETQRITTIPLDRTSPSIIRELQGPVNQEDDNDIVEIMHQLMHSMSSIRTRECI